MTPRIDPARAPTAVPVLRMRDVAKEYPGVRALKGVSFDVLPGRVHALVGENGAGKSTLISLIAGTSRPSWGQIEIDQKAHGGLTPRLARSLGIRLVPQERQLCHDLSVGENILLGRPPMRGGAFGVVDRRAMLREATRRLHDVGLADIDPRTHMRDLTVVQAQLVEVARAISDNARLIIMDEPTAALGGPDVEALFSAIRRLRDRGVSFLYVSHHLQEIYEIGDDVTVLRDGRHITTRPIEGLGMDELVKLLLGRAPEDIRVGQARRNVRAPFMHVRCVVRPPTLHGVSLTIEAGEVLAVTGGIGSGRRELARMLVGIDSPESGFVTVAGGGRIRNPAHAVRTGIAFLPEDRKGEGVLGELSVADNIGLGRLARSRGLISVPRRRRRDAVEMVGRFGVKTPSIHQPARLLSGGNQQKCLLARWLSVGVRALVLDGPTEGIDIGSRLEIYSLLRGLADEGVAVVIFTADIEEVKLLADRAVVLGRGRIVGELRGNDISEEALYALQYGDGSDRVAA